MKPHFHKVPLPLQSSFGVRHDIYSNFGSLWHYHPEWELHYVIKGEGVRLIGDNISHFSAGEIVLLGGDIPHAWICKEEYFQQHSNLEAEAIVLHFHPDSLGQTFLELPEARVLQGLYQKANKGMVILKKTKQKLIPMILSAKKLENMERLIALLSILNILSETAEYEPIMMAKTFYRSDEKETERLNAVYNYTLSNYKQSISLETVARICNLTTTSFCRYFKLMTKKKYSDFLTEIRISHACRFLIENRLPVEQISDQCGFYNKSNFYRNFKIITGMTPLAYKRTYLKNDF